MLGPNPPALGSPPESFLPVGWPTFYFLPQLQNGSALIDRCCIHTVHKRFSVREGGEGTLVDTWSIAFQGVGGANAKATGKQRSGGGGEKQGWDGDWRPSGYQSRCNINFTRFLESNLATSNCNYIAPRNWDIFSGLKRSRTDEMNKTRRSNRKSQSIFDSHSHEIYGEKKIYCNNKYRLAFLQLKGQVIR